VSEAVDTAATSGPSAGGRARGATAPRLGAFGVPVADLGRSVDFYTRVVGMVTLFELRLPDMDEAILGFPGSRGPALVLMRHTDGSTPAPGDRLTKIVLYVPDPTAFAAAVRADGLVIEREPAPVRGLGDAVVGFARDPDGHRIEILEA
jgi:catechol 2,3-dioxygenase-like lactoylglutathione lyase family enzyme